MKSNEKEESLARRVLKGEISLKGAGEYYMNHVKKHPTFKTISEEHNKFFKIDLKSK